MTIPVTCSSFPSPQPCPEVPVSRVTRALSLVVLAVLALSAHVRPSQAARAYVVESDFSTGSFSSFDTASLASTCDVASAHSDARVRAFGGRVYVVNRFGADNVTVLDGTSFALVRQFSVGNGANPYDIAVVSATRAYVTRYESADLWVVNPSTGAHTGTVSLAAFADADGIPEMDRAQLVGPLLFVSLQRVDRANGFQPTDTSLVAVIDTRTDTVVDCDPTRPGAQAIVLPRTNPVTPFVLDVPRSRLYLGCAGTYGVNDGGVVALDPVGLTPKGVVASEDSLGGDVLDVAWTDDARAFAIVSDAAFNTSLVRWSPVTGRRTQTLYAPGGFSLADVEVRPDGAEVWVCNSSFSSPGVRAFAAATGLPTGAVRTCTLPPQGLAFEAGGNLDVPFEGPDARVALAPPAPNPARSSVHLRFALATAGEAAVDVFDVTGRRVRSWTVAGSAGPNDVLWDLRQADGARVHAGMFRVRVRAQGTTVARSLLIVP